MDNSTSVDTLVYQLEDDDPRVRWDTLQRLRKRVAIERTQIPVRNPRRFLHCLRRRLSDDEPRIAREALLLLADVIDVLRDDVDQILASVLPHLIPRLSQSYRHGHAENDEIESDGHMPMVEVAGASNLIILHEETFQVFRKYVNVANDLAGVANVLMNLGLAHARASVREAALVAMGRLLDERYGRRCSSAANGRKGTSRIDSALFTELTQAIVPVLEDPEEQVVVAAEEAIAKLQFLWGQVGFQEVMQYLSGEDKIALHEHSHHIEEFVRAASSASTATTSGNVSSSMSASQVAKLRASLASPPIATTLLFGFVPDDVIEVLHGNTGNSNAEWKKRTAAVEQLYAAAKQVDGRVVVCAAATGATQPWVELVDVLLRLLQDIDVHLVKRSLQIQRLVFHKISSHLAQDDPQDQVTGVDMRPCVDRVLPVLVETAANFCEDEEITSHVYAIFQVIFSGELVSVALMSHSLISSLHHRRQQIREEALRVWMVLLLTAQAQSISANGVLNDKALHALGKVLGDGSSRVRLMATETAAVLASVTRQDVCAILEEHLDDFALERVDLDALYGRLCEKRYPVLLENGQLQLSSTKTPREQSAKSNTRDEPKKASHSRSPVRASTHAAETAVQYTSIRTSSKLLPGHSELEALNPRASRVRADDAETSRRTDDHDRARNEATNAPSRDYQDTSSQENRFGWNRGSTTEDQWRVGTTNAGSFIPQAGQREVTSAPGEPIADKLQALKRKTELLKKSASTKQVLNQTDRLDTNPQDSGVDFSSRGYAAQQQPSRVPTKQTITTAISRRQHEARAAAMEADDTLYSPRADHYEQRSAQSSTPPSRSSRKDVVPAEPPASPDDRPIRPLKSNAPAPYEENIPEENSEYVVPKTKAPVAMSLATKKRLEAKQRLDRELELVGGDEEDTSNSEPSVEAAAILAPTRPISLATRKRLEAKTKADSESVNEEGENAQTKDSQPPSGLGKQEPLYLETHQLHPLKDPKQETTRMITQLRSADWEANFDALTTVRRLAAHHPKFLEDKIHAVMTEILKQVPNLRSSVVKNALLALDSMCSTFGKLLDSEVENIIPALMKRCTDSNTFVCESNSASIRTVILHCSTGRVVNAVAAHLSSRAPPIRREVARAMHTVLVGLTDQVQSCKELPSIFNVLGKCLEDSNNEVRDAAKQSIIYLHNEQIMDGDKMKRLLPPSVHSKIDPLLTVGRKPNKPLGIQRPSKGGDPPAPKTNTASTVRREEVKEPVKQAAKTQASTTASAGGPRRGSTMDPDALATLTKKLESGNWKDRFDAVNETGTFMATYGTALCESGKVTLLFDSIVKRMEDGNAKVSTLALEQLPSIISSLGDGMELVLSSFVPAVAKGLAANNAKQVSLAHAAIQTLCSSVDARVLCQHLAAVARHANTRVKPTLLEVLEELAAANGDDKTQFALTRYVLPLALDLLKEGKSDVKDVNARLLQTLYRSLGQSMFHSSYKLSGPLQDKLMVIVGST